MQFDGLDLQSAITVYNAYRAKISAEDNLIHYRISWMLAAEAILFVIWGALALPDRANKVDARIIGLVLIFVSIFGIVLAVFSFRSIAAALREMKTVKANYKSAYPQMYDSNFKIPRLHADRATFNDGMEFAKVVPWIFVAIHIGGIIYVVCANIARLI